MSGPEVPQKLEGDVCVSTVSSHVLGSIVYEPVCVSTGPVLLSSSLFSSLWAEFRSLGAPETMMMLLFWLCHSWRAVNRNTKSTCGRR